MQLSPSQPRTIAGVVINSATGRPIARALVQAGQHAMFTDAEGRFEFRGVTEGYVVPSATRPGYFPENFNGMIAWASGGNSTLTWSSTRPSSDAQTDPLEVKLVPEAILSGLVTDGSGVSLEGITVQLRMLTTSNGLRHWDQRMTTTTNAEGEFRFAELQAGEYALQTALKVDGPTEGEAAAGYASVDYPVLGANGAGALQLHAGDHLEADMSTSLERLYPVSGVINGLPEGASLSFTARRTGGVETDAAFRQNPQTREFRMLLPSGSFEVRARSYAAPASRGIVGEPAQHLIARHLVTVAHGAVSGVSMRLEPMATLPVEVAEEKTAKLRAGAQGPSSSGAQLMYIGLVPAEADAAQMTYSAQRPGNRADPVQGREGSGTLLIRDVPPGQYFLQVLSLPPWYIASAFCGSTDLTRERLSITGSAAGCTLRLVLRDDAASLKFSVSDAKGDRGAPTSIYFVPLDNLTRDVLALSTGPEGKGSMDMPPGQYLVLATRQGTQLHLAFRDPESLRRYEAEGRRIDLPPGGNAEVRLDVIAGEP